ncbi:MAG: transposase [Erysipelotrichaceae bacterium]|nr:transposase [Erysipelotrichaceae bacterium]
MNFDYRHKYPMVILDFISGEPIDIVNSRRQKDKEPYFYHIPLEERLNVKYLICDMYNPYINYVTRYFPNAQAIVDGFHVKKWILDRPNTYYRSVLKRYKDIENAELKRNNFLFNTSFKSIKHSREVNILQDFKFILFENVANIDYTADPSYNFHLGQYLDTFQKEKKFMDLDPHFPTLRALKESFNTFDNAAKSNTSDIDNLFDNLIRDYRNCEESVFNDFARLLIKYRKYLILEESVRSVDITLKNSFLHVKRTSIFASWSFHFLIAGPPTSVEFPPIILESQSYLMNIGLRVWNASSGSFRSLTFFSIGHMSVLSWLRM